MKEFKQHLKLIQENNIKFVNPSNFENELNKSKNQRKSTTIDDGYTSFYKNAWPILKESKYLLFCL